MCSRTCLPCTMLGSGPAGRQGRGFLHYSLSPWGEGGGPAPRGVQDKAPNLTWFRGEGVIVIATPY